MIAPPQLTDPTRQRIESLIADDRIAGDRVLKRLREIRGVENLPSCSTLLFLLTHLTLDEHEAEQLLVQLMRHRGEMAKAMGRDPGLRVAALDYLTNINPLLRNPTIVESSELRRTEKSLITDDLTGLFNRRYALSSVGIEIRRSRRYVLPLTLLMLDLDGFKSVNDLYGHPHGDLVLQWVGRIFRRGVRDADLACRIGGDEFLVVLPETERLGAYVVAERVRVQLEKTFAKKQVAGRHVPITVSGGIAAYPDDGEEVDALIASADKSLYLSKIQGRNRVTLFHAERRGAVRFPVDSRTVARVTLRGRELPPEQVRLVNLSTGGVLLEVFEMVATGDPVRLVLNRPGGGAEAQLEARGVVVRADSQQGSAAYRAGIAFSTRIPEPGLRPLQLLQRSILGVGAT